MTQVPIVSIRTWLNTHRGHRTEVMIRQAMEIVTVPDLPALCQPTRKMKIIVCHTCKTGLILDMIQEDPVQ